MSEAEEADDTAAALNNIKETVESILVAFVLAFIFRAFVVEAFVIPTGSMATTLLGAHMHFVCPDCGYEFDVNYSSPYDGNSDDPRIDPEGWPMTDVYCPNCGKLVASGNPHESPPTPVAYGDRILVMKYVYLLHPPQRWDVVVFKSPDNPQEFHYTQNYIKRLVGSPGEWLEVLDGSIYVSKDQGVSWTIQPRPPKVQDALWRVIYDNDFYPHLKRDAETQWVQPWQPTSGSGWNLGTDAASGRIFHFDSVSASGELTFKYDANTTTQTMTDYLVYDSGAQYRRPGRFGGSPDDERANPESDLKLAAAYQRTAGNGPLLLKLVEHEASDHTFIAQITPTDVKLLHLKQSGNDQPTETQIGPTLSLASLGIKPNDQMFVELMNADYQVTLRINGKQVIQSTPTDFAPNVKWLTDNWINKRTLQMGEAHIQADSQTCTLTHLSLWKNIYYTNRTRDGLPFNEASPSDPVKLGSDEYFTMGDNSEVSEDARVWPTRINLPHEGLDVDAGRVPGQFLLGQAIFVYWPAGFRAVEHPPLSVIPDFGDMRWIH